MPTVGGHSSGAATSLLPIYLRALPSTSAHAAGLTDAGDGFEYVITAYTVAPNWHTANADWSHTSAPSDAASSTTNDTTAVDVVVPHELAYWALLLLLFPACTIFGNVLVIMSVLKFRQLQCAINYFILALAVADCLVAVTVMPFAVYVVVNGDTWEIGHTLCDFYMTVDVACSTASILTLTVISFDRYRAVTKPIEYSVSSKNTTRVAQYMTAIWSISILVACPMILGLNKQEDRSSTDCRFNNAHYSLASSCVSFGFPLITILFVYARIVMVLRARTKSARLRKASARQAHMERRQSSVAKGANGSAVIMPPTHANTHKAVSSARRSSVIPLARCGRLTLRLVLDTTVPPVEGAPKYSHAHRHSIAKGCTAMYADDTMRGRLQRAMRGDSNAMDGSKSMCSIDETTEDCARPAENTSDSALHSLTRGTSRGSVFSDHASDALLEWTSPTAVDPPQTKINGIDEVEVVAETELPFDLMDPLLSVVDVDDPPAPELMLKYVRLDELHRRRYEEEGGASMVDDSAVGFPILLTSRTPHLTSTKILATTTLASTPLPAVHSPRSNGRTAHFSLHAQASADTPSLSAHSVVVETSPAAARCAQAMPSTAGTRTVTFSTARSITESTMSKDEDDFYCENSEATDTPETIKKGASSALIRGLMPFQSKFSMVKNIGVSVVMSAKKKEERSAKRAVVRKEKKATKTLGIVVAIFLTCWVPFFWINVQNGVCVVLDMPACQVGYLPFFLTTWLGYVNSFVNPIIYTIFNPEFRRAFSHIITCKA